MLSGKPAQMIGLQHVEGTSKVGRSRSKDDARERVLHALKMVNISRRGFVQHRVRVVKPRTDERTGDGFRDVIGLCDD